MFIVYHHIVLFYGVTKLIYKQYSIDYSFEDIFCIIPTTQTITDFLLINPLFLTWLQFSWLTVRGDLMRSTLLFIVRINQFING